MWQLVGHCGQRRATITYLDRLLFCDVGNPQAPLHRIREEHRFVVGRPTWGCQSYPHLWKPVSSLGPGQTSCLKGLCLDLTPRLESSLNQENHVRNTSRDSGFPKTQLHCFSWRWRELLFRKISKVSVICYELKVVPWITFVGGTGVRPTVNVEADVSWQLCSGGEKTLIWFASLGFTLRLSRLSSPRFPLEGAEPPAVQALQVGVFSDPGPRGLLQRLQRILDPVWGSGFPQKVV
ncbi:uncharacterized protein LOC122221959 [Panthera leo]|uniref:uncharacterized protein LOC122221959 n=1 Tax=Panthera leo TaxID=9689 RepID=UPI001C695651|nr:uncharacterized protein LOC122221959 [Panthera leo]